MTGNHPEGTGDPHVVEAERVLAGLHFSPRASLGPEIAGRARRGERPRGGGPRTRSSILRPMLGVSVGLMLAMGAGVLTWKAIGPQVRIDSCCQDLDGGGPADDGFVLEARGRRISQLKLYEDRDGSGSLSPADFVRFARGAVPALTGSRDARTARACCADLDGEGLPDDGVLVLSESGESIVLAAVYEQHASGMAAPLR